MERTHVAVRIGAALLVGALIITGMPGATADGCRLYQTTHITVIIHSEPDPYPITFEGDEDQYICIIPDEAAASTAGF